MSTNSDLIRVDLIRVIRKAPFYANIGKERSFRLLVMERKK